jgi:hypothetical protein
MQCTSLLESSQALAAVPFQPALAAWAIAACGFSATAPYTHMTLLGAWTFQNISNRLTIWTPTPEIACQAITCFLDIWVKQPHNTTAIFLIPRILQHNWSNLSRHVVEIGVVNPDTLPPSCRYFSDIPPFVALTVLPYQWQLPDLRLDASAPQPQYPAWIRHQIEDLCGLH